MCLAWGWWSHMNAMCRQHSKCTPYVIGDWDAGKFNQTSQCSQDVIAGSRPPHPQWNMVVGGVVVRRRKADWWGIQCPNRIPLIPFRSSQSEDDTSPWSMRRSVLFINTGGEGPWNQWKHLGNIEGTGSICLRCFHQTQFDYIWNVTITCIWDGTAGNIWVTSGM